MYKVYRVEHKISGIGPYQGHVPGVTNSLCDRHNKCKYHPPSSYMVIDTGESKARVNYMSDSTVFCGFDSMTKLGNWFRGFRGKLRDNGFVIAVYTLDPIYTATDGRQVIFDRSKALLIEKRDVGV